jgi:hypothetical protein
VLQLAASDSARSASSTVQIIVNPQPVHQAPVVSAGSNQTITLPTTTATLAGTVSDDGLAGAVTSTWSVVSGPGSVTFANANAPGTTATFSTLGTYVLKLTATDPALSGSAQMQVVVQPQGSLVLALHLPFDEGSGTTAADTSGNGRNGTLSGGTTWITGKIGHALQFNGTTGEVTVPDFPLSQQFSVAFWFKASNLPNMYSYMFSWGTVSNVNSINIWFYVNGAITLRTDIQDSVNADPTNYCDIIDANMANGQWHHYCATVANGTGLTVYIDGQSRVTYGAVGGHTITPATNLFIGSRDDNNSARYFAGSIDDVRIYSQALSASDVQNLYNAAPVVTVAPPPYTHNYPRAWMQSFTYPWTLAGSVSDDGLPNPPGACTVSWSTVSGPGTVTFDTPNQAVTTAVFSRNPSAAGNYVLMLDANDGQLDGNVQVTVIVMKTADFSGDGKLDGIDFLIWQAHYPTYSGASPWEGDANGDGKVDGVDFLTWQANYHG